MESAITATTEPNPRKTAAVDSKSSESGDFRQAIRLTDEYTAAFDLEVWKAQQQARFRAQLRQAKEKLERRIYAELANKDKSRLQELEHTRRDLEEIALRLEAAGEALQKRQAQLEARESAFEVRRVRVAEQHEVHLSRVEQRAQRVVEEAAVTQESLKAQLREKGIALTQMQERLLCAEKEYDMLQRRTAKVLSDREENSGSDAALLREAEERLGKAAKAIQLLQSQLREHVDRVDRLGRERDTLLRQHHDSRMQIHELTGERNRLAKRCERCEAKMLKLEERMTSLALTSHQRQKECRGKLMERAETTRKASGRVEDDLLLDMLQDLKHEIADHMSGDDGGLSPAALTCPGVICETQSTSPELRCQPNNKATPTTADPYIVVEEIGGVRAPGVRRTAATLQSNADSQRGQQQEQPSLSQPDANLSAESGGSYHYAEEKLWRSFQLEGSGNRDIPEGGAVLGEVNDPSSENPLPPLAPQTAERGTASASVDESGIFPSPEDFTRAATVSSEDAATTRTEMEGFVHQLKVNRERLLETGVYSPGHPIVKEMTEKILLYEQYLGLYC